MIQRRAKFGKELVCLNVPLWCTARSPVLTGKCFQLIKNGISFDVNAKKMIVFQNEIMAKVLHVFST